MHPYDFPLHTESVTGNMHDYFDFVNKNYFEICKGRRILEVGPLFGEHTKLIANHNPNYLECVEGNPQMSSYLEKIPCAKVVIDDIWLNSMSKLFDIVVCFGVLYHHHSALHLLELFVNLNDPEYIMLDCVTAEHPLAYLPEQISLIGSRAVRPNWKHCGVNFKPPFFVCNMALINMGYKLEKVNKLQSTWVPKSNGWVARWKKSQNEQSI